MGLGSEPMVAIGQTHYSLCLPADKNYPGFMYIEHLIQYLHIGIPGETVRTLGALYGK